MHSGIYGYSCLPFKSSSEIPFSCNSHFEISNQVSWDAEMSWLLFLWVAMPGVRFIAIYPRFLYSTFFFVAWLCFLSLHLWRASLNMSVTVHHCRAQVFPPGPWEKESLLSRIGCRLLMRCVNVVSAGSCRRKLDIFCCLPFWILPQLLPLYKPCPVIPSSASLSGYGSIRNNWWKSMRCVLFVFIVKETPWLPSGA